MCKQSEGKDRRMAEGMETRSREGDFDRGSACGGEELLLRNHITYIVEKTWTVLLIFVLAVVGNDELRDVLLSFVKKEKLDGSTQMHLLWFLGVVVFFLVLLGWFLNRWYRTTIVVKDGTISYSRVTLFKKSNTMSAKQISNVNIEQNIFEMIFGTCKLRLDTDSMTTADNTDMEMILKKRKAEQVKKYILAMKEGTDVRDIDSEVAEEEYDIVYTGKEMILNGLLSMSVKQLVLAVGFLVSFVITLRVLLENVSQGDFQGVLDGLVVLLAEFLGAYSLIWAILKKILLDFRFRAKRKNEEIYVTCGLWKKKSYMVPVNKINAVKIEYPVFARIFGRGFLRVLNVGGEGEEVDGMKLLLLGKYDELKERMEILLPEYQMPDVRRKKPVPRQWMYIRAISSVVLGGICGLIGCGGLLIAYGSPEKLQDVHILICLLVGVIATVFWLLLSYLTYKTYGIGYMERELLLVHGIFRKEISLIPYDRIQYICYQQGPMERLFGIQHGYVALLASMVSRYRHMGSFRTEDFEMLEEKLRQTY